VLAPWDELKRGAGCPLCAPRTDYDDHRYLVRQLRASTLYLTRGQHYLGACALVFDRRHVAHISQLRHEEWTQFATDLWACESAILRAFSPDHINVECLGNTVPHLHFGLIPRYKHDGRWGRAIWSAQGNERDQLLLTEQKYAELASRILQSLEWQK
jgi:diadenosine tetraphosphate (Ap4A) HIT family hydrolase